MNNLYSVYHERKSHITVDIIEMSEIVSAEFRNVFRITQVKKRIYDIRRKLEHCSDGQICLKRRMALPKSKKIAPVNTVTQS